MLVPLRVTRTTNSTTSRPTGHPHCDRREQGRPGHHPPGGQAGGGDRLGLLRAAAATVSPHINFTKYGWHKNAQQLLHATAIRGQLPKVVQQSPGHKAAKPPNSCNFHK